MLLSLQQQREVKMEAGEGTKKDSELEDQGRRLGEHLEVHRRAVGVGQGEGGEEPGRARHLASLGPVLAHWIAVSLGCAPGAVGLMRGHGLA